MRELVFISAGSKLTVGHLHQVAIGLTQYAQQLGFPLNRATISGDTCPEIEFMVFGDPTSHNVLLFRELFQLLLGNPQFVEVEPDTTHSLTLVQMCDSSASIKAAIARATIFANRLRVSMTAHEENFNVIFNFTRSEQVVPYWHEVMKMLIEFQI